MKGSGVMEKERDEVNKYIEMVLYLKDISRRIFNINMED
jgi:hypothetical protein